jgi:multicomponent Na+:H+ antiporter subunit B
VRKFLILLSLLFLGLFLFLAVLELPEMGNSKNPSQVYTADHYLREGVKETGVENIVTAISFNYRGYDTFGGVTLILTVLCSVLAILKQEKRKISYSSIDISCFKSSIVAKTVLTALLPFVVLFAFYTILHSEILPGGGFQGGVLLGSSVIIFTVVFGSTRVMKRTRFKFEGAAIFFFVLVGLVGMIFGANFLTLTIPGISTSYRFLMAQSMLILLQVGFAISIATIFISIFFSMYREEG